MKRVFTIIGMGAMILAFQNCQKTSVSSANDSLGKVDGQLTPVTANDPEDAEGTILQPDAPTTDMTPPAPGSPSDDKKNPPSSDTPPVSGTPYVDSGDGNVCILEGPGKSIKLGVSSAGVPGGQHKIPSVLCMSARACLEIASQAFGVKGPEFRGYCKLPHGNPHVVHISEAQLQAKVNQLLNP